MTVKEMLADGHNAHSISKATGWSYSWCYTAVQAVKNSAVPNYSKPTRRTEIKSLLAQLTAKDFRENPPATIKEAQERIMRDTGALVTLQGISHLFEKWGLPIPQKRRGRGYKAPEKPNPALETLRSELQVLCMSHPDSIPTSLVKELLS